MTLQQTLQANTNRTKELFAKLEETSDQAVKTRENLFEELSRELRLHADLEQKDLLPALRANDKTKALAADAAKLNQDVRARVNELEALPKNDPQFRPGIVELRKLFQRQLREERAELLPAIQKELSDEQAETLVKRMEAKRARAEEEQRAEDEARKQVAKREAEAAKAVAARERAVTEVVDATKANARELRKSATEAVREGAETVRDTSEKAANTVANAARRAKDDAENRLRKAKDEANETLSTLRETARERGADVRAVASAIGSLRAAGPEIRAVMMNSIKQTGRDGLETTKQVLRNPRQFGKAQRDFAAAATHNLMISTKELLNVLLAATGNARQPIDKRLKAS